MPTAIDQVLENNRRLLAGDPLPSVERTPTLALAIVTCMDARINVWRALGLTDGDAHIIRNAGGLVTPDVIQSLVVSQRRLGTSEIMLIHHTDCGMENLAADEFREELVAETGVAPDFEIGSFADVTAAVRSATRAVRDCAFLPHRSEVRGFVYDVTTHALSEVE